MDKYYDKEQPIEVVSEEHGEVRYYKEAGRFQISRPKWISPHDGKLNHGKTVTINIDKFINDPAMIGLFEAVLNDLKQSE